MLGSIFGSAPSINTSGASTYMDALNGIAGGLNSDENEQNQQYGAYNAGTTSALNSFANYLKSNNATDQSDAQITANAEKGEAEAGQKASANLDTSLAQRGIAPGSSLGVGGQASIAEGLAANDANVQAQTGEQQQAQHNANLGTLYNVYSNAANTAFGRGNQLSQEQSGIDQELYGDANQQALEQYQQQQAQSQGVDQLLGAVGGAAATIYGGPAAGALVKSASNNYGNTINASGGVGNTPYGP